MSTIQEQPVNIKAAALTIAAHAILLLLFFYITYQVPELESIEEMGIEVNLGSNLDAYGNNQPMSIGLPAPSNTANASSSNTANTDIPSDILESDDAEAPAINTSETKKNSSSKVTESKSKEQGEQPTNNSSNKQKARYVYSGSEGTGGNGAGEDVDGSNEGVRTGNGDMGVPNGTAGANNYSGTPGSGGGISHNINGRSIVAFPPRDAEFKESGTVTVRITVNRQGAIVSKRIVSASNSQLRSIALQKASKIRFNKSTSAPEEQFGNITFVFKTRS